MKKEVKKDKEVEKDCMNCSDHNLRMWAILSKENQILKQILKEHNIDYLNWKPKDSVNGNCEHKNLDQESLHPHMVYCEDCGKDIGEPGESAQHQFMRKVYEDSVDGPGELGTLSSAGDVGEGQGDEEVPIVCAWCGGLSFFSVDNLKALVRMYDPTPRPSTTDTPTKETSTCRDCKRVYDCPSASQGHVCDEIEKED